MGRNKRSLEIDSSRVSPPNKMPARSNSNAISDEILNEIKQLQERFSKIEQEVAEITKFVREVTTLRAEVGELRGVCEGYQRLELENKKRCVLLKGLKFQTRSQYETRPQTRAALAEFFGRLEMTPHLVDYQRLGGRRENEDGSKVSVRVQFVDVDQKYALFDKLQSVGRDFQDVSVLTDYPSFQLTQFKHLSSAAYKIRQENPGTKTRVIPKGLGLSLQRRPNATDKWTTVSAQAERLPTERLPAERLPIQGSQASGLSIEGSQ